MSSPGHATLQRAGFGLLAAVSALLALGYLGIVSGELLDSENSPSFRSGALTRLAFTGVGIASGLVFASLPTRRLRHIVPFLYAGSCLLLACCFVPQLGVEVGGSHRWIAIPFIGIRIQPSEFAKPAIVIALASILSRPWFQSHRFVHSTLIPGCLAIPPIALIALEMDLGYTALLGGTVLMLVFLRGIPLPHVWMQAAFGLSIIALGILSNSNRLNRLNVFLNLDALDAESGYQQWRAIEALKRAPSLPTGAHSPGLSTGDHLPYAGTDFVLPAIGETWGIIFCLLVILAYFIVMRAGLSIAKCASDSFSRLAASGLLALLFFQVIINVGVGLGLLPVSGMPLPLVSAGGSNLVASSMMMGVLWRIRTEALRSHS